MIIVIDGIKYVRTDGGALLKHADHLSPAERIERFGDINYTRDDGDREAMLVDRYTHNLPLSISDKREARRIIKSRGMT